MQIVQSINLCVFIISKRLNNLQEADTLFCLGTLYTGLADGRIVKLEGDKVVDVVRTGKQMANCGELRFYEI